MKMMSRITFLVIAALLLTACENQPEKKEKTTQSKLPPSAREYAVVSMNKATESANIEISESGWVLSRKTGKALKKELRAAIKEGGLEYAVTFCNTRAMEITDSISKAENVDISRLAKKFRNPSNEMNERETNIYKNYVLSFVAKDDLNAKISWNDQGEPTYYYPIMVEGLCLKCHGTPGKEVDMNLANKIAELYPNDIAMQFKAGDPRGMWAISFPNYKSAE